jgi:hypothetical protein
MDAKTPNRWLRRGVRLVAITLALLVVPRATCTAMRWQPECFSKPIAGFASTNEQAVREAIQLIRQGDGTLALVRLDLGTDDGEPGGLRTMTTYLALELAHALGVFGDQPVLANATPDTHARS